VHLKQHACAWARLNYFAFNIRHFSEDGTVKTKTLSVSDRRNRHASVFILRLVPDDLKELEIEKKQSVCAVADNASNVIITIEKLKKKMKMVKNSLSSGYDR